MKKFLRMDRMDLFSIAGPDVLSGKRIPQYAVSLAILVLSIMVWLPWCIAAPENETLVSLGEVSGLPKSQVMVPLFLTPSPPELRVGSVTASISFESKGVSFIKAEKGFLLDGVNAEFATEIQKDPKNPDKAILRVKVDTKGEPRKALREGLLLTLVFQIVEGAVAGTKVSLEFEKVNASDLSAPPKEISPLANKKGSIEVIPPEQAPYVACFFFSH